jgi:Flp pilus assembly protein TadB
VLLCCCSRDDSPTTQQKYGYGLQTTAAHQLKAAQNRNVQVVVAATSLISTTILFSIPLGLMVVFQQPSKQKENKQENAIQIVVAWLCGCLVAWLLVLLFCFVVWLCCVVVVSSLCCCVVLCRHCVCELVVLLC